MFCCTALRVAPVPLKYLLQPLKLHENTRAQNKGLLREIRLVCKKEIKAGEKTQASYELIAPAVCTIPVLFSACRFSPECFNIRGKVLIMCSNMTAINRER